MEAGQPASEFWHQTPRTFDAVLKGVQKREQRHYELAMFEAWQVARFTGAVQAGKLKRLDQYLPELKPRSGQTPAEMVATLKAIKGRGVPMNIRKVEGQAAE